MLRYGNAVLPANKPYLPLLTSRTATQPFLAGTHFTAPWRVEGWVDVSGWLHAEINCRPPPSPGVEPGHGHPYPAFPLSGVTAYLTHKILVKTHKKERQCVKWRKGFSGRRPISYGCALVNIMGCCEEVSFQVFSELSWISHGMQIFRQSVPCRRPAFENARSANFVRSRGSV